MAESNVIKFTRTIGKSEVKSTYLNLTDDNGILYGARIPLGHTEKFNVIDGEGRITYAQKHHENQIWGTIKNWFSDNDIVAGTKIEVKFDPEEIRDKLPVIHLVPLNEPLPKIQEEQPADSYTPREFVDIPVGFDKLVDVLVSNLHLVEEDLEIYFDDQGRSGKNFSTEVGVIDLLCRKKNGDFLVIELKKDSSSDAVIGQTSRYLGWVKRHLAKNHSVLGLILSPGSDDYLDYSILANPNISLKYYKFTLHISKER